MSGSDSETAFASADEGEGQHFKTEEKQNKKKSNEAKQVSKKDTGQQQKQSQRPKKKGNKISVNSPKDSSSQSDARKSSNTKTAKEENITDKTKSIVTGHSDADANISVKDATSAMPHVDEDDASIKSPIKNEDLSKSMTVHNTSTFEKTKDSQEREAVKGDIVNSPEKQDITRDQAVSTDRQEEVPQKSEFPIKKSSGASWGWSSWGSSLLSAASSSVQTFTHQVGDGFSTIIDSVESSLGIPQPEHLAKDYSTQDGGHSSEKNPVEKCGDKPLNSELDKSDGDGNTHPAVPEDTKEKAGGWFSGWGVSDLAKKVTDTGKSLASKGQTLVAEGFDAVENLAAGSIDVLETIGKKTYNTLSEHDPAFRKTREFLSPKSNKPNLSSVLREARDKAEEEAEFIKENEEARKSHFGTLFDDYQGLAHLEALEILSNQSEKKVHSLLNSLSAKDLSEIKPELISIKDTFAVKEDDDSDVNNDEDVTGLVNQCLAQLKLGTAPAKLNTVLEMVKKWIADFDALENNEKDTIKEVHQKSIQVLAELTAKGVEQFHKAGELILLGKKEETDFIKKAQSLARLTGVLCHEVGSLAARFVACLNKMSDQQESSDEITQLVTNIYLEATNSSTYIQDAFVLLLPVVQHAAIEQSILLRSS